LHAVVDVRHRDGRVERDVPAERLASVHPFAPGQFVVGGGWVGRIDSIRHDVRMIQPAASAGLPVPLLAHLSLAVAETLALI
jgi:hypothetical protein